jgi:high affinity sulfate transporter 1
LSDSLLKTPPPRGIGRWLPLWQTLKNYPGGWLMRDIGAGLALTAILVPVGMGYAQAAGLPAIYGLYATIVPLVVYAVFGPSRILVLGPDSALAGLIAATILPLAAGHPDRAVALASALAVLSGGLCIAAGLARFGFITDLLSKPIRYGYLNGIALTVLVGQLPKVLGFSAGGNNFLAEAGGLIGGIRDGQVRLVPCLLGIACLAVILLCRRYGNRIPGVLLAVVASTLVVSALDLSAAAGVAVIGTLPQGLPRFQLPALAPAEWRDLGAAAVAIALVSFADMSALSRTFAHRAGGTVNSNQEIIALGAANVAAGFFQGFPVTSSASRTPVAEAAGARTQIAGVVGAVCIALLLVFAPALLRNLPQAALGAVVIAACVSLVEIRGVLRLYRLRPGEFILSLACFLGVALLGVIQGIFIAVGLALLAFIWRAWRPYDAVLGYVGNLRSYHDISRYPDAKLIDGLVLFRWDAPLFFVNAETFRQQVQNAVAEAPTPTRWVVVAAEPITDVDVTAADMLAELDEALHRAGMDLIFAEMKDPVKDSLKRYGLFNRIGVDHFFPTIEQAVERYLALPKADAGPAKPDGGRRDRRPGRDA